MLILATPLSSFKNLFLSFMEDKGDILISMSLPHTYEYDWYMCAYLGKESQAIIYQACLRMYKMKEEGILTTSISLRIDSKAKHKRVVPPSS